MGNSQSAGIRYASPNEKRCIIREDVDFYRSLYIAGIYQTKESVDLSSKITYLPGLRKAIQTHAVLSVVVKDTDTEKPFYTQCSISNLEEHVEILPTAKTDGTSAGETAAIEHIAPEICDTKPQKSSPPWRIFVLPFDSNDPGAPKRAFIAFAFSHSLGDGVAGLAFHKAFLIGLQENTPTNTNDAMEVAMYEPFDTSKTLPISWGYLLAPALGVYLPKFIASLLGLRAAASTITPTTWLGTPSFHDEKNFRTGLQILVLDSETLQRVLNACKKHDAKLTSLFALVVAHALGLAMPEDSHVDNFVSGVAINMRPAVKIPNDQMGLFVSGYYDVHPRTLNTSGIWEAASQMTKKLNAYAGQLQDQAIGLLRYLPSVRSWTVGKIGAKRDSSFEVSNLLTFEPAPVVSGEKSMEWEIGNMFFCQPAHVTGGPMAFNVVSRKGGDLVCTVSWQIGSTGFGNEVHEHEFIKQVRTEVDKTLREIC